MGAFEDVCVEVPDFCRVAGLSSFPLVWLLDGGYLAGMTVEFNKNLFANLVKEKRKRIGLTQKELGEKLNTHSQTINSIENERFAACDIYTLFIFSRWLNEPMESFFIYK